MCSDIQIHTHVYNVYNYTEPQLGIILSFKSLHLISNSVSLRYIDDSSIVMISTYMMIPLK